MRGFNVTFERVSEESAADGDACARGFIAEGLTLRDALPHVCDGFSNPKWCGPCEPDSRPAYGRVRWLTFHNYNACTRDYFESGEDESRALHIPASVTNASTRRIARLFGVT